MKEKQKKKTLNKKSKAENIQNSDFSFIKSFESFAEVEIQQYMYISDIFMSLMRSFPV